MSKNLLFISPIFSSFVKVDVDILSQRYNLIKYKFDATNKLFPMIYSQWNLLIFLFKNILKTKYIYIWFADYHSLLPTIFARTFNKSCFIVIGGYDVADIPELNYGAFGKPIRKFFTKISIKWATYNLPVSDELEILLKYRVNSAKSRVIHTGYNSNIFHQGNLPKENIVLTVGIINSIERYYLKGIDIFISIAHKMPHLRFIVVGITNKIKELIDCVSPNIQLIQPVSQNELVSFYQRSKIYAQFSKSEGLPNVICEAMLCGCYPIAFNVGGIKTAMGGLGTLLSSKKLDYIIDCINNNLETSNIDRTKIRNYISKNFTIQNRSKKLYQLLDQYD